MKKFSWYGMVLLAAALCLTMTSFTTDNTAERGNGRSEEIESHNPLVKEGKLLLTKIHYSNGKQRVTQQIKYDLHHRPIEILSGKKDSIFFVDYNTDRIYENGKEVLKQTFTHEGYIKTEVYLDSETIDSISYSYDSQGHLVGYCELTRDDHGSIEGKYEYVWENGNLVKIPLFTVEPGGLTIEYSDVDNRFLQITPEMAMGLIIGTSPFPACLGLHGIGPRKLPKKIIAADNKIHIFEYKLNSDGSIRQETVTTMDEKGENVVHKGTYKYYYKRIK